MTHTEMIIQMLIYIAKMVKTFIEGIAIIVGFVYGIQKLTDYLDSKGIK